MKCPVKYIKWYCREVGLSHLSRALYRKVLLAGELEDDCGFVKVLIMRYSKCRYVKHFVLTDDPPVCRE